mgnify:CR=1 FL=1
MSKINLPLVPKQSADRAAYETVRKAAFTQTRPEHYPDAPLALRHYMRAMLSVVHALGVRYSPFPRDMWSAINTTKGFLERALQRLQAASDAMIGDLATPNEGDDEFPYEIAEMGPMEAEESLRNPDWASEP